MTTLSASPVTHNVDIYPKMEKTKQVNILVAEEFEALRYVVSVGHGYLKNAGAG